MKMVFDIDGVLCDEYHPDVNHRHPYIDRINTVNQFYDNGHTIVIYTSRGMNSCNDDAVASDLKYRSITEKQLAGWGLKYHSLFFGKPNADIYVDNKNLLLQDFFDQPSQPRSDS
jgi:hypothetical protein